MSARTALLWMLLGCASLLGHAAPQKLTAGEARHLLIRSGFAPTQHEVEAQVGRDARVVVAEMVARSRSAKPLHPAPAFVEAPPPTPFRLLQSVAQRQEQRQAQLAQGMEIKRWWVGEMVETPTQLRERMTLFWHNHFATSQQKVVRSQAMWRQHMVLREHSLGSFRDLLHAVAKDPAMLVYLDGANSRKDAPNENFAREVMELFTLGEASQGGAYTEQDIREVARALTGWSVDRDQFTFQSRPRLHDAGNKTVFGQSGNFDGDAVLDLILAQPVAARFVVSKLWREFVSPEPVDGTVAWLATGFAKRDFDIAWLIEQMLLVDEFWDPANRGTLVKSPIELIVGTVRQLGVASGSAAPWVQQSAALGQNLLVPPNVKGWPGYTGWIDSNSLLGRRRFVSLLFQPTQMGQQPMPPGGAMLPLQVGPAVQVPARQLQDIRFDAQRWLAHYGGDVDREPDVAVRSQIQAALLAVPASQEFAAGTVGLGYLRSLMLDAAYQLK